VAPVPDARLLQFGALRLLSGRVHHGGGRLDAGALDAVAPVVKSCWYQGAPGAETMGDMTQRFMQHDSLKVWLPAGLHLSMTAASRLCAELLTLLGRKAIRVASCACACSALHIRHR
jgi:hypothetical protein